MEIIKNIKDECIILGIEGWLDVETTPQLSEYMSNLEASEKLVLDFSKLEYISSSGVREVVACYRRQKECGGSFEVVNANEEVLDVFNLTGISKKISISPK